jgi:hypothetical protein
MEKVFHATRNRKTYSPSNMVNNLRKIFKKVIFKKFIVQTRKAVRFPLVSQISH